MGAVRGLLAGVVYGAVILPGYLVLADSVSAASGATVPDYGAGMVWGMLFVAVLAGTVAAAVGLVAGAAVGALYPLLVRVPVPFPLLLAGVGLFVGVLCAGVLPLVMSESTYAFDEVVTMGLLPAFTAVPAALWHLWSVRRLVSGR